MYKGKYYLTKGAEKNDYSYYYCLSGVGKRMGQDIPKQFITIEGKPIIIYTLESFQKHPQVDRILVVCKSGWEETMWAYIKEFNISKVQWVITGDQKDKSRSIMVSSF